MFKKYIKRWKYPQMKSTLNLYSEKYSTCDCIKLSEGEKNPNRSALDEQMIIDAINS